MPARPRLIRPPRVLIASDPHRTLWDVEGALGRRGYSVLRVFAGAAVLARARAGAPDVILLDQSLADRASLELARELSSDSRIGASTPILVLVAARPKRQDHLSALRAGVWGLVRQPVDLDALVTSLATYLDAKLAVGRGGLGRLRDDVTGVYTRRGLARRSAELLVQAAQHRTSVACAVVAPEGEAGPGVLLEIARLLTTSARRFDAVGRLGRTEFAVVAPGANRLGARRLVRRLQDAARALGNGALGAEDAGGSDGGSENDHARGTGRTGIDGGGGENGAIALRAGFWAVRQEPGAALEPRRLVGRAARALALARLEGRWVREARGPRLARARD